MEGYVTNVIACICSLSLLCSQLCQLITSSLVQDCSLIVWQKCQAVAVSQPLSPLEENTLYLNLIKAILSMEIFILYERIEKNT